MIPGRLSSWAYWLAALTKGQSSSTGQVAILNLYSSRPPPVMVPAQKFVRSVVEKVRESKESDCVFFQMVPSILIYVVPIIFKLA